MKSPKPQSKGNVTNISGKKTPVVRPGGTSTNKTGKSSKGKK